MISENLKKFRVSDVDPSASCINESNLVNLMNLCKGLEYVSNDLLQKDFFIKTGDNKISFAILGMSGEESTGIIHKLCDYIGFYPEIVTGRQTVDLLIDTELGVATESYSNVDDFIEYIRVVHGYSNTPILNMAMESIDSFITSNYGFIIEDGEEGITLDIKTGSDLDIGTESVSNVQYYKEPNFNYDRDYDMEDTLKAFYSETLREAVENHQYIGRSHDNTDIWMNIFDSELKEVSITEGRSYRYIPIDDNSFKYDASLESKQSEKDTKYLEAVVSEVKNRMNSDDLLKMSLDKNIVDVDIENQKLSIKVKNISELEDIPVYDIQKYGNSIYDVVSQVGTRLNEVVMSNMEEIETNARGAVESYLDRIIGTESANRLRNWLKTHDRGLEAEDFLKMEIYYLTRDMDLGVEASSLDRLSAIGKKLYEFIRRALLNLLRMFDFEAGLYRANGLQLKRIQKYFLTGIRDAEQIESENIPIISAMFFSEHLFKINDYRIQISKELEELNNRLNSGDYYKGIVNFNIRVNKLIGDIDAIRNTINNQYKKSDDELMTMYKNHSNYSDSTSYQFHSHALTTVRSYLNKTDLQFNRKLESVYNNIKSMVDKLKTDNIDLSANAWTYNRDGRFYKDRDIDYGDDEYDRQQENADQFLKDISTLLTSISRLNNIFLLVNAKCIKRLSSIAGLKYSVSMNSFED